jgi:hypothetical protein
MTHPGFTHVLSYNPRMFPEPVPAKLTPAIGGIRQELQEHPQRILLPEDRGAQHHRRHAVPGRTPRPPRHSTTRDRNPRSHGTSPPANGADESSPRPGRGSAAARQPSSMAWQTLSSAFSTPMPAPRWAGTLPKALRIMCGRLVLNAKSRQGSRKTAGQGQVASSHQHPTRPLKPTAESLDRPVPASPWGSTGNRRIRIQCEHNGLYWYLCVSSLCVFVGKQTWMRHAALPEAEALVSSMQRWRPQNSSG